MLALDAEFNEAEYAAVAECTAMMQAFSDEADTASWRMLTFDLRLRALPQSGAAQGQLRFQVEFMLRCFMLAQLNRSADSTAYVIRQAINIVLPPVLRKSIMHMLMQPGMFAKLGKSTVSRWRLLIDVAFMIYRRRINDTRLAAGNIELIRDDERCVPANTCDL